MSRAHFVKVNDSNQIFDLKVRKGTTKFAYIKIFLYFCTRNCVMCAFRNEKRQNRKKKYERSINQKIIGNYY